MYNDDQLSTGIHTVVADIGYWDIAVMTNISCQSDAYEEPSLNSR